MNHDIDDTLSVFSISEQKSGNASFPFSISVHLSLATIEFDCYFIR